MRSSEELPHFEIIFLWKVAKEAYSYLPPVHKGKVVVHHHLMNVPLFTNGMNTFSWESL